MVALEFSFPNTFVDVDLRDSASDNQVIDPVFFRARSHLIFNVSTTASSKAREMSSMSFLLRVPFLYSILSESFESTKAQV